MRRFLLICAICLGTTLSAFAQGPDVFRELLSNGDFQMQFAQDLQITGDQGRQLAGMAQDVRNRIGDLLRSNGPMMASKDDRDQAFKTIREEGMKITREVEQKLSGILNDKQLQLYHERTFQMSGGLQGILLNPSFGKTLELTEEQLRKVTQIQEQLTKEAFLLMDKLQDATPEERTAIMQQLQALGEKGAKMIEAILDNAQKVKMEKLKEEVPDYIWKSFRGNRNKEREWRPGADSWKPGQGAPVNVDIPREERSTNRQGRRFPGQDDE